MTYLGLYVVFSLVLMPLVSILFAITIIRFQQLPMVPWSTVLSHGYAGFWSWTLTLGAIVDGSALKYFWFGGFAILHSYVAWRAFNRRNRKRRRARSTSKVTALAGRLKVVPT